MGSQHALTPERLRIALPWLDLLSETSDLSSFCPVVVQSVKTGQTSVIFFVTAVLPHIMTCSGGLDSLELL